MATYATPELMHLVLDGEATPEQAQALRLQLAGSEALRAEFAALQALFRDIASLPQRHPPEGLVHAVMTAVNAPKTHEHDDDQLSAAPRVFGSDLRVKHSETEASLHRIPRSEPTWRRTDMNKMWIGGGIAAIAVVLVAQFGFSNKPDEKAVSGTIVPADRYRAPQATGADIKVGAPTAGTTGAATATAPAESTNNAAQNSSAQNSSAQNNAAQNSAAQANSSQNNAAQNSAAQNNAAQANSAQNSSAQNSAAQNSAAQNSSAQNSAAQNSAAQNSAAQNAAALANAAQNAAAQDKAGRK